MLVQESGAGSPALKASVHFVRLSVQLVRVIGAGGVRGAL